MIATLFNGGIVIEPEHIQIVLFDNARNFRLHPGSNHGVRNIQLPPASHSFSVARKNPFGMFAPQLRCRANTFDLHPEPEAQTPLARIFAYGGEVLGQPGARVPVTHILRPAVWLRAIPPGVDHEHLRTNIHSQINFPLQPLFALMINDVAPMVGFHVEHVR